MNQSMNPATVGMFMYIQVVYAFLCDIFAFNMTLSALQFIGSATVFLFSIAAAYEKKRADELAKKEAEKTKINAEKEVTDDFKRV